MIRAAALIVLYLLVSGTTPAAPVVGDTPEYSSYGIAPRPLLELWLRFHEAGLCQGMDSAFEFNESGMKVRSLVEDEKSFQRLQEMLEPLQSSFQIELDVSRPKVEKKSNDENENDPPPGIWENYELRSNMGDPVAQAEGTRDAIANTTGTGVNRLRAGAFSDEVLKQRLRLYAEQILDQKKKMERYASDMRVLVHIAFDPAIEPALQAKAGGVSLAHAQELGKLLVKLEANLSLAIPKSKSKGRLPSNAEKSDDASNPLLHSSDRIANDAHALAQRIYRFVHPEQFTVDLDELREPSLLESIKDLFKMDSEFQKEMDRSIKSKK
jgi:hypothetical protein